MENVDETVVEMEKELYVAAMKGNVDFLEAEEAHTDEYLRRKTHEKNNIIHIAIRHERHDFVEASLKRLLPINDEVISERNSNGNTPLHVAAEVGNLKIVSLVFKFLEEVLIHSTEASEKPWRVQNFKGNTPLHVALTYQNVKIARFLLEKDSYLAYVVNHSREAPLHVAIKHHVNYSESESIMARIKQPINEEGAPLVIKFATGEDISSMISYLVEKGSCVTCWRDANGLTPLHSAASLRTPYNLQVIRTILYHWPQSAEVCDASGNTILHLLISKMPNYQQGKNLLKLTAIYALRDYQDQHGNTPLHIAAANMDTIMVQVLLESSTKINIKNLEGVTAGSLIQQHNMFEMLRTRKMTEKECEAADSADISFLRKRLTQLGRDFLVSQDCKGRNVLHRLLHIKIESRIKLDDFVDFIEQAVGSCPALVYQTDLKGNSPVHILARNDPDTKIYVASTNQDMFTTQQNSDAFIVSTVLHSGLLLVLLEVCNQSTFRIRKEASIKGITYDPPWLLKNAEGNTAVHEAIMANNNKLVRRLLEHDGRLAGLVNNSLETPLHVLARRPPYMEPFKIEDIKLMVDANVEAAFSLDQDSFTPLMRASQVGNLSMASMLCSCVPESAKIPDINGNTPFHLAIEGSRFDLVQVFFDIWKRERESSSKGNDQWLVDLLHIQNKAGTTPADLIGELPSLPFQIEETILSDPRMMGIRSAWGIPKSQLQTYMNSMNVIAALLTTVTFTTAFNVPGGLVQDKGTPVLIQQAIFQVFMISDVLAMCLSMLVLLCLLWIMATSNPRESVMIQDFSVSLMLASFVATLLTFMTGLYATIFPGKPWIAIVTLILCSSLMMLVHKVIVLRLLIPCRKATVIFLWKFRQLHADKMEEPVPAACSAHSSEDSLSVLLI